MASKFHITNGGCIADTDDNEILVFGDTANAINQVKITNNSVGYGPTIEAEGGDTNIDMNLTAKGTGRFKFTTNSTRNVILDFDGSDDVSTTTLLVNSTDDRTITFPDATGTLLTSGGALGTPVSGVLTNCTGTASGLTAGNATLASTVTVTDSSANTAFPVTFHDESNSLLDDTGSFTYNPSTGTLSATSFSGTIATAAQANITSVGTLTALTVDDVAIDGKVITMTGSTGDTAVFTVGTDGTLDIVTTDSGGAAADITITADGTAEVAGTTVTLNSSGGITLDADNGTITFSDNGTSLGTITSSGYSGTAAKVTVTDNESTSENNLITFVANAGSSTGAHGLEMDGDLHYNPGSGTLTATTFSGSLSGNATSATTVTVTDNESTSENNLITFVANAGSSTGAHGLEMDGDLHYNPGSGTLTATGFSGKLVDPTAGNALEIVSGSVTTKLGGGTSSINFTPSSQGHLLSTYSKTFNDNSTSASSTTTDSFSLVKLFSPTLTASNANVITNRASTLEISGAPSASTNMSFSDSYALRVNSGTSYFSGLLQAGGNYGITVGDSAGQITGKIKLTGGTQGSVTLISPASVDSSTDYTITLPSDIPSQGEFLKVSGYTSQTAVATTEWASGSGGASTIGGLSDASYDSSDQEPSIFLGHIPTQDGGHNIGIGKNALDSLSSSTARYNIGLGNNALTALTNASNNVAIGHEALASNSTGYSNVAIGKSALTANTGGFNLAIGTNTLSTNTNGFYNVGLGHGALSSNTSGGSNVSIGYNSGYAVTSGTSNTLVGTTAAQSITTGGENTSVGASSLSSTTVGDHNVSIGYQAVYSNAEGGGNTAVGVSSLYSLAPSGAGSNTYSYNTALGYEAGYKITSGTNNTILGVKAAHDWSESGTFAGDGSPTSTVFILETGKSTTDDFYNGWTITFASDTTTVALRGDSATVSDYVGSTRTMTVGSGLSAAPADTDTYTLTNGVALTTGSNNTVLGYDARTSVATVSNEITLGNSSVTSLRCADTTIASLSDARDKTNVIDSPYGLDFIDSLRPVQFTWQRRVLEPSDENHPKNGTTRVGFLAQDFQAAMPNGENDVLDLVYDVNPERIEAKYGNLIPVLTQAIKDLKAQNDALTARVEALENA